MQLEFAEVLSLSLAVLGGVGLAAACGLRVFLPMLILSIAGKSGVMSLGEGFAWMTTTPAMVTFGVASVIEVGAYYVPWLDHALDAISTPCALVAGTLAVASQVTGMDPWVSWTVGVIAGASVAGLVQGGTILLRSLSTVTTGGAGNSVVSTIENVGAFLLAALAILVPILALVLVCTALFVGIWLYRRRRAGAQFARPELVAA